MLRAGICRMRKAGRGLPALAPHLAEAAFFLAVALLLAWLGLTRGAAVAWVVSVPLGLIAVAGLARAIYAGKTRSACFEREDEGR